jgi:hypothetical protein
LVALVQVLDTAGLVVRVLLSFDIMALKKAQAEQSPHLADTPSTHLHRLAHTRHKEKLNGTFCKSC